MPEFMSTLWFYWIVAGVVGTLGAWLIWRGLWRDRSRGRPRCPKCWYRLDGTVTDQDLKDPATFKPVTCSECGRTTKRHRQLFRTRRRWIIVAFGVMLLTTCWYGTLVRERMIVLGENYGVAAVPTTVWIFALSRTDWPFGSEQTLKLLHLRTTIPPTATPSQTEPIEALTWWQRELLITSLERVVRDSKDTDERRWAINWLGDFTADSDSAVNALCELTEQGDTNRRDAIFAALIPAGERAMRVLPLAIDAVIKRNSRSNAARLMTAIGPVQFEQMSDDRLCEVAMHLANTTIYWGSPHEITRDLYLYELIRRRSESIRQFLQLHATKPLPSVELNSNIDTDSNRKELLLELLTALRRLQGQPDPVHVDVTPTSIRGTASELPSVSVTLRTVETLEHPIAYQQGGDNRGERPGRWRFHVVDAQGNVAPVRPVKYSMGGLSGFGQLKPGDVSQPVTLDMNAFMDPLPPGRYTVTVQYHNGQYISDMQDVSRLILCTSDPIELVIEP